MHLTPKTLIWASVVLLSGCSTFGQYSPLASVERRLVFQPSEFPAELDGKEIPFENVEFESADKTKLHGWFADHPDPVAVALFCHGNAGNIASRGNSLAILNQRHRLAVMAFDYRGYGKSEGKPSERGILADARAARAWLAKRKGIAEEDIVLMGRSMGGGVAVDLAANDGARGLVLASTFSSFPAVAKNAMPYLPASLLMTQRFDSLSKIHNYPGPLLQSHGDADELIPIDQAKALFDAAPGPKQFLVIPNGRHNDPQTEAYRTALDAFLRDLESQPPER
jgi:fermentation-respiration switch protein FrsA (DUF1100 family)